MSKDGFYSMTFAGAAGVGTGMFVLDTGIVVGADVGGATYDGTYVFNSATGLLELEVTMCAPAGVWPVQTGVPLTEPLTLPFKVSLPREPGPEKPLRLTTPLGPINIVFKKIRDFPN